MNYMVKKGLRLRVGEGGGVQSITIDLLSVGITALIWCKKYSKVIIYLEQNIMGSNISNL